MWNAGIILDALFWNGKNGLQYAYVVNNGLQMGFYEQTFFEYHTENGIKSTTILYW